jgi:mevalonate kinase
VEVELRDTGLVFSWPCSLLREALRYKLTGVKKPRPCSSEELSVVAILLKIATGVSTFLFLCTSI